MKENNSTFLPGYVASSSQMVIEQSERDKYLAAGARPKDPAIYQASLAAWKEKFPHLFDSKLHFINRKCADAMYV